MILVVLATMPLVALLFAGVLVDRAQTIEDARHRALDMARLGAEQQDDVLQESQTLLAVLARVSEIFNSAPACHAMLERLVSDHPRIATLSLADSHGQIVCNNSSVDPRINVIDRHYVQRLLSPGGHGFDISDLLVSRATGLPMIYVGLALPPAPGGGDQAAGVLSAGIKLSWVSSLTARIASGKGNNAIVVDTRDGSVLVRYPEKPGMPQAIPLSAPVLAAYRQNGGHAGVAQGIGVDGVDRIYGFAPLPGTDGKTIVSVGLSFDDVLAQTNARTLLVSGLIALALLVAVASAWLFAWRVLVRPVGEITRTALRLGAGNLAARVDIARSHGLELGLLGTTLNEMAAGFARAQAERTESEARFRLLADNSSDMIFRLDLNFRRIYVSPASRDLLGYAPEELMGTAPITMIHPDDAETVNAVYREMAAGQERGGTVNRIRHRDGRWLWVDASYRLIHDPDTGARTGIVGRLHDITARVEAERMARRSDARATLALEATNDIVFAVDRNWLVTYANPKARWFQSYRERSEPRSLWDIEPGLLGTPFEACYREVMSSRTATEITAEFRGDKWFKAHVTPSSDDDGGIFVFVADVTAVRQLEEFLLGQREAAVAVAKSRSEFLANMSHELRTPLNSVIGFAELIESDAHRPSSVQKTREYALDIRQSGEHLLSLINEILDFSKAEAGKLQLYREVFDPAAMIETCVRLMAPRALRVDVTIDLAIDRCPMDFVADEKRIKQILLNLLSNAIKFTPAGGTILVSGWWENGLMITVRDTGIGIPESDLERVMEAFTQVDNSRTRSQDGTGLGLPLSRRLAEMHGGSLQIESTLGAGTLVILSLPEGAQRRDAPGEDQALEDIGCPLRV